MTYDRHQIIISLASNCEQERHLEAARQHLQTLLPDARYTTEHWTEPVNSSRKEPYLNQLCQATTQLGPQLLTETLKLLERQLGRTHNEDGIVALDLDLLQYDDQRMHLRDWERSYIKELLKEL